MSIGELSVACRVFFFISFISFICLVGCDRGEERTTLALVNGTPIYADEAWSSEALQEIANAEENLRRVKLKHLNRKVDELLMSQQAKKANVSVEELLKPFQELSDAPVSPDEIRRVEALLDGLDQMDESKATGSSRAIEGLAKTKQDVLAALKEGRKQEAEKRFLSELRERASIKTFVE